MTKENIETKLEKIKNCVIRNLPTTPDYNIKLKTREDIGKNIYEIKMHDPITGWGINSYYKLPFIVYASQEDKAISLIDDSLKPSDWVEGIVDLLERSEKNS